MILKSLQPMSINTANRPNKATEILKPSPFIKWAGGKQGIAAKLVGHFPKNYANYFEPFIGGGSVLLEVGPRTASVSDSNGWLIDTYIAVKEDWLGVTKKLDKLRNTKTDYLKIRKIQPSTLDPINRAAHFIYLNKTGFRGLFRVNQKGEFNVPYGAYDRRYYSAENIAAVSSTLQSVSFNCCDFEETASKSKTDDFVYFDPPYYKLGGYSDFNRYTSGQFREMDQMRLASLCNELDSEGVKWAVSNSDTPLIRKLYNGYRIIEIENRREINLKSHKRSVTELLILNY